MTITVWSDFACPYCYIGENELKKAIEDLGLKKDVTFEYRAYELDPEASDVADMTSAERIAHKYKMPLDKAEHKVEEINATGRSLGLMFNYDKAHYTNTLDAHRLMKYAAEHAPEKVEALNNALFKAYFGESTVLSSRRELADIAKSAGLDRKDVETMLETDRYTAEVRADEQTACNHNITGVPFFVIDGEYAIPGALSSKGFKDALERISRHAGARVEADSARTCSGTACEL